MRKTQYNKMLTNLLVKGRLIPIIKEKHGQQLMFGYKRKSRSRKRNQTFLLASPRPLTEQEKTSIELQNLIHSVGKSNLTKQMLS